jgi:hypothetical protein
MAQSDDAHDKQTHFPTQILEPVKFAFLNMRLCRSKKAESRAMLRYLPAFPRISRIGRAGERQGHTLAHADDSLAGINSFNIYSASVRTPLHWGPCSARRQCTAPRLHLSNYPAYCPACHSKSSTSGCWCDSIPQPSCPAIQPTTSHPQGRLTLRSVKPARFIQGN